MLRVALLARGHERGAFGCPRFAAFAAALAAEFDLHLYVHTWAESEAKQSHRPLQRAGVRPVTEADVRAYFAPLDGRPTCRMAVLIDDDAAIRLTGDAEGRIGGIPARAWKNMWYGQCMGARAVVASGEPYAAVLCVRLDVFRNPESAALGATEAAMAACLRSALMEKGPERLFFLKDTAEHVGIDNVYAGPPAAVAALAERFHCDMDRIRRVHAAVWHQEYIVFYEAEAMRLQNARDAAV
jgi:hypothetical protein